VVNDRLCLDDVRFFARHGITAAEHALGAWFSVDAELWLDLEPAARTDDLGATVDYGHVARLIVDVGMKGRVNLIERLAGLIAETLLREFPIQQVRIRVRKLAPPLEGLTGTPAVELTRQRT
jgi:dihydroneopterin aldolase